MSHPKAQLRRRFRKFLARNTRLLAQLAALWAATLAGLWLTHAVIGGPTGLLWFVAGAASTAFLAMAVMGFLMGPNMWMLAGSWGEDSTRDALDKATNNHTIHGHVDSVPIRGNAGGWFDIDHIVVAPCGVLAIETKWHYEFPPRAGPERDLRSAARSHDKLRTLLCSVELGQRRGTPSYLVVVVWGPGQFDLPDEGQRLNGIRFIPGRSLTTALQGLPGPEVIDQAQAAQLLAQLTALATKLHLAETRPTQPARHPPQRPK